MEHKDEERKQTLPSIRFYTGSLTGRVDGFPGEERRNGLRWNAPQNSSDTFSAFTSSSQMNQQELN